MIKLLFHVRGWITGLFSGKIRVILLFASLALLSFGYSYAQTRTLQGVVKDAKGETIIGANIVVDKTQNGATTDIDGRFTLNVSSGDRNILVSYIGYVTKIIPIAGISNIEIILDEDTKALDEVVVIGYGTVAKKELTSAVSHVSSKDFLNISSNNPIMQIQGKVSGVSVQNTAAGDPNAGANIQVRGVASRAAGNAPLIVIDGVPGGNLDNINENDIESIDVLKGGAASAIYGTRGSNSVIIVTTKKGSTDGAFRATYTGYLNIAVPKKQLEVLSASEFREHIPARGSDYGASTDWIDAIIQTGITHNHTIQVSGGTPKNNYRATVDVRDGEGIDIRSSRKEVGARLSVNHTASNDLYRFTFNVAPRKIDYNNSDQDMFHQALTLNPTMPVKDPDDPNKYFETTGWEAENPVERLKIEKSGGTRTFLDWDGKFRLNLLPLFGSNDKHFLSTEITIAQQIKDNEAFWFRPSTSTLAIKRGYKGEANQEKTRNLQESLEWIGNYGFDHNGHNIKVMGGYSYQYQQYTKLYAENKDFTSDELMYNNLGNGNYMSEVAGRLGMESKKNDSKLISFFGRATYDYLGKYLATASLRYEGSSKFGANNKWGYFPAFSLGWRVSEESFMKDIGWINDLKVRGDYGVTGNQDFDSYKALATYGGYGRAYYDGRYIQGWAPNKNTNPNLKWEKGKNWNLGIDFSLLNNRVSGSVNYYNRKQEDLLGDYNVPLPPHISPSTFVNVGSMRNQGIEIDLNIEVVDTKDFSYTLGLVGSTTSNKFLSFSNDIYTGQEYYWLDGFPAPGSPGSVQIVREGQRIGTFFTYQYAGTDDAGNWMIYNKEGEVIPINEGTDEDKRNVGNGLPKFTMSWSNLFRYKNVDLTLFFRGNFGYQIYNVHEFYWGLQSAAPNLNVLKSAYGKNAHIVQGMNAHNSYFVEDADYLKLDVATLGYTWKTHNKWIESLRFYVTGRNLFTITKYDGVDPESFMVNGLQPGLIDGNKKAYYPSSRQYLLGVQVNF